MNQDRPIGSCGRARLLLSLEADGAATPAQRAELEAHLPRCEDCRGAAAADRAVRARIAARAGLGTPAWSAGFAERTARIAVRERREARLQNRLLWACAAAAVVVAATTRFTLERPASGAPSATASIQETTRVALIQRVANDGK